MPKDDPVMSQNSIKVILPAEGTLLNSFIFSNDVFCAGSLWCIHISSPLIISNRKAFLSSWHCYKN
jgi:hypothetical protein